MRAGCVQAHAPKILSWCSAAMKEDKAFRNISARQKGKTLGGGLHISLYIYIYIYVCMLKMEKTWIVEGHSRYALTKLKASSDDDVCSLDSYRWTCKSRWQFSFYKYVFPLVHLFAKNVIYYYYIYMFIFIIWNWFWCVAQPPTREFWISVLNPRLFSRLGNTTGWSLFTSYSYGLLLVIRCYKNWNNPIYGTYI